MLKYQNTYRMEPQNLFKTDLVDKIMKSVMNNRLDEVTYDAETTKLCSDIAAEIRRRVKKLNFDRCMIVCISDGLKNDISEEEEGFLSSLTTHKRLIYNIHKYT